MVKMSIQMTDLEHSSW